MRKITDYKKLLVTICFVQSFCVAVNLYGFLGITRGLAGNDSFVTFFFIAMVLVSICIGTMSPQWLIRILMMMAGRAQYWLKGKGDRNSDVSLWLPQKRTDVGLLTIAIGGGILLFAVFSMLASLYVDYLWSLQSWLGEHFLLGFRATRFFDMLITAILIFPTWCLYGLMIALFYRLSLSLTTSKGSYRVFEKKIPMIILAGLGGGCVLWQNIIGPTINPVLTIQLSQLPAVVCILLLVGASRGIRTGGSKGSHKIAAVALEQVSAGTLITPLVVILCGVIVGAVIPLFYYLLSVIAILPGIANSYAGLMLIALATGMFISLRGDKPTKAGIGKLAGALQKWAGAFLIVILLWSFIFPRIGQAEGINWLLGILLGVLNLMMFASMTFLGTAVAYCKQMAQDVAVSRLLGWARWLILLTLGIIAGWGLAMFVVLELFGSLMLATFLIMGTILFTGLIAIYKKDKQPAWQNKMIYSSFILVVVSSVVISFAAKKWLKLDHWEQAIVLEHPNGAFAISPRGRDSKSYSSYRLFPRIGSTGSDKNEVPYNYICLSRLLSAGRNKTMLVIGMDQNRWPLPKPKKKSQVDFLLAGPLLGKLGSMGLVPSPKKRVGKINLIDQPIDIWRRWTNQRYDIIWLHVADYDLRRYPSYYRNRWWKNIGELLNPEGMLLVQLDSKEQTGLMKKLTAVLERTFEQRGGRITFGENQGNRKFGGKGAFIIAFAEDKAWQKWLTQSVLQTGGAKGKKDGLRIPPAKSEDDRRIVNVYGIKGVFHRFAGK